MGKSLLLAIILTIGMLALAGTFAEAYQGGTCGTYSVPEPSTLLLLGSGLTALAIIKRRSKKL